MAIKSVKKNRSVDPSGQVYSMAAPAKSPSKSNLKKLAKLMEASAQKADITLEEIANYCKDKSCRLKT